MGDGAGAAGKEREVGGVDLQSGGTVGQSRLWRSGISIQSCVVTTALSIFNFFYDYKEKVITKSVERTLTIENRI